MLRLPAQLEIGPYTIHLDVLAARLQQRRRRIRRTVAALLILALVLVGSGMLLPYLRGTGIIVIPALPPEVRLTLDDQQVGPGPWVVAAGAHTINVEKPGAFPVRQVVQVTRDQTTTLPLPLLRPLPELRQLPLPQAQSSWLQVSMDAGGGWRLQATRVEPETTQPRPGWGPAPITPPRFVLHLDAQGLTRQSILETYPVADEVIAPNGDRFWAMWSSQDGPKTPGVAGTLTIVTPALSTVISTTETLRGVWWAPGGRQLLVALPHDQGHDLALIDPHQAGAAPRVLITVPGVVSSVHWQPEGRAAVVLTTLDPPTHHGSSLGPRPGPTPTPEVETTLSTNAVLILLPPAGEPHALRLRTPPIRPAGLLPLAWTPNVLWWATDTGLGLALDRVNLATGGIERVGALPERLVALTVLPDAQSLRIVRSLPDGALQVERWPDGTGLFTLPGIHSHVPAGGTWRDGELLLATNPHTLWYIRIAPEALP
jgi:hypothetical protein